MLEIMTWAVGKAEDLLSFLSRYHVKAAKIRMRNLRVYEDELSLELNKVQNEIDRIKYFLDQEYKEL